jgi:site-specific DNA-adenine methylase
MWSYYGSKLRIVKKYPAPEFDTIVEPFAGTAAYAMRYWDRNVTIVDSYDVIIRVWQWLQQCSIGDILGLPRLKFGESVDDYTWDCVEAKWLMGMLFTAAPLQPKKSPTKWRTELRPNTQNYRLETIAASLYKIKHWKIILGDYRLCENQEATWFIDPPYQFGGEYYVKSNRQLDYGYLAEWCAERKGQVIVCENHKANWLPFVPLVTMHGLRGNNQEMIYTNGAFDSQASFQFDT